MILLGTIVNGLCIMFGSLLGKVVQSIPEKVKETVLSGIGLTVIVLGLQMGFKSENFLIVIISIVVGAILGEWWALEDKLNLIGHKLEEWIDPNGNGNIAQGFITATLIFAVGAMAILGALDSGIRHDHSVLYTKSILDGFTSLILTSTLGIGVLFSAIPVVLYQGIIALFAEQINRLVPGPLMDHFIVEMTAVGGVMIFAIGLSILDILKVRVANLLPSLLIVAVIVTVLYLYETII